MKNLLTKLRYKIWGKEIQKAMEMAEKAGRETSDYAHGSELIEKEWELEAKHKAEVESLVNKRMAELNYSVNPDDVISATQDRAGNTIEIRQGDKVLTKTEIRNLKSQVDFFRESQLYKLLMETPKDKAQQIMFQKSQTYDDMKSGKMLIFAIDILEKILQSIEKFDVKTK